MMKCLHGEPAAYSTTQNGSFWFCNQSPSCHFFCSEDERYLFEKAIELWKSTIQPQKKEKAGMANAKMYTFLEQNIRVFLWLHKLAHRLTFVIIYFLKIFLSLVFHGFGTEA